MTHSVRFRKCRFSSTVWSSRAYFHFFKNFTTKISVSQSLGPKKELRVMSACIYVVVDGVVEAGWPKVVLMLLYVIAQTIVF